jgi:Tol biopolymer transport system component
LKRLEQEARVASALNHPNVCTIYQIAEHAGHPFIVMEFLEGETLREQISEQRGESRRPSLDQLIDLGLQVSDALAAAHSGGIIHRDIKPANIFITRTGVAKILDFGVAKLGQLMIAERSCASGEAAAEIGTFDRIEPALGAQAKDSPLTRTGLTMGTAGYMSPEQVRGEVLDGRTDLFSFGLVLYEMATGRAAFGGATAELMRNAILHSDPTPVRELNPDIPEPFSQIISKALEKEPHKRYRNAAEMRAAVEASRAKATRKLRYRYPIAAVAGVALLATVAFMWLAWQHTTAPPSPNVNLQQLTTNSWENPVTNGALSLDGRYVAYADTKGLHVKAVGSDGSQMVARPEALRDEKVDWDIQAYAWFPDGRQFVATSHPATDISPWAPLSSSISTVWSIPVDGGAPRKLRDGAIAWSVSPDGSMIAFGTNTGRLGERELWIMGPDGGQVRRILQVDPGRAVCCLSFFQDGKRVSYVTTDASGDALVTQDLNGGPVATVMGESVMKTKGDLVWLPEGSLIYSDACVPVPFVTFDSPCTYWMARFDIRSGRLTGRARRLTSVMGASVSSTSATPDGRRVAFVRSTESGTSYVAEIEAGATRIGNVAHLTLDEGEEAITDWTPDGRTAIIVSNRGNYSALYRQKLGTNVSEPIITRNDRGWLGGAILSPDGKWIILLIWTDAPTPVAPPRPQVWHVAADGSELRQLFALAPGSAVSCARAPATLCVTAEPTADRKQTVVAAFDPATGVRGGELLRIDRYPNRDEDRGELTFGLSPDGRWVSTSAAPGGPLRILSLRGDATRVLSVQGLNVKEQVAWTPDGSGLIVTNYRDDGAVLLHVDLQGKARELFKCESAQTCRGVPSPDGKHLGIYQRRLTANIWILENF